MKVKCLQGCFNLYLNIKELHKFDKFGISPGGVSGTGKQPVNVQSFIKFIMSDGVINNGENK